jgi:hypothetical protein
MPDFGIMRGFNEKLFGDKLVAGQLPTQLGLIGSQAVFDFDPDAQAFFDRVTAAGGTLSATEKTAVDTLVKQMKLDGIWSLMKAIYPMVGASAAACAQNLKSSSFTGTFTSGWTFASTGVTPNGTSAFMQTGLIPSVDLSQNDVSLGAYSGTTTTTDGALIGAGPTSGNLQIFPNAFGVGTIANMNDTGGFVTNTQSSGFFMGSRIINTQKVVSIRGTLTTIASVSSFNPTFEIYIGARNNAGAGNSYDIHQNRFAFIGNGLTNTQLNSYYTLVQTFQTTLSRNV